MSKKQIAALTALFGALSSGGVAIAKAAAANEHRVTALEVREADIREDIREIKADVKELLRRTGR